MKILHIELGRNLFGGAQQVSYLLNGVNPKLQRHVLVCDKESPLAESIVNQAITLYPVAFAGDLDFKFVLRLGKMFLKEKPDLVHIHSRRGELLAALTGKIFGVPRVLTRRVDNVPGKIDCLMKSSLYSKVICISQAIKIVMQKAGIPIERLSLISSGVDTEQYKPRPGKNPIREEFGLPPDSQIIAMVAQFIPRKGHRVLIEAVAHIVDGFPRLHVLFFGKGENENQIRQLVEKCGLSNKVHFAGFRSDMSSVLPFLDLVVHPAFAEGLGVALLEASACGIPIVASRVGGIPEIVHDEITGQLVEPGNSKLLGKILGELLNNRPKLEQFGKSARELACREFSRDQMIDKHEQFYQMIASNS